MKPKIFTAFVISLLLSCNLNAQVSKKSWLVGGMIQYSSGEFESPGSANGQQHQGVVDLSAGYVFRNNQALGLLASYARSKSTNRSSSGEGTQKDHTQSVGAFYRAYQPLKSRFYLYGQATALYSLQKATLHSSPVYISEMTTVSLSVAPGLSAIIFKNIHMELGVPNLLNISYSKSETNTEADATAQEIEELRLKSSLSSGLLKELSIGFRIFL